MNLTVQIFHSGQWHDAAILTLPQPELGRRGPARLGYETDYAIEWMLRDDEHACSLALPVELMINHDSDRWFGVLDDIIPSGAARRYWVSHLGLGKTTAGQQDCELLQRGTIAPVGNLRIKEAVPQLPAGSRLHQLRFTVHDVVERHTDFLERRGDRCWRRSP